MTAATNPGTAEMEAELRALLGGVRQQLDADAPLTKRDRLILLSSLNAGRLPDDGEDVIEEAVEYIDELHLKLHATLPTLLDALAAQRERETKAERQLDQVVEERDAAEECISDIYYKVTGRSPDWSNLFGRAEALEEIGDHVDALKLAVRASLEDAT